MKKIYALTAAAVLMACNNIQEEPINAPAPASHTPERYINASFEDMTKAGFTYDATGKTYSHFWDQGDAIAVFPKDDVYDKYTIETAAQAEQGVFTLNEASGSTPVNTYAYNYAIYPYGAVKDMTDDDEIEEGFMDADGALNLTVGTWESVNFTKAPYGYGNIMVARSTDNNMEFKNLVGWLKIQMTGDAAIKSVLVMTYDGTKIGGNYKVTFDTDGNPVATLREGEGVESLEYNFHDRAADIVITPGEPADIYLPLMPCTLATGTYISISTDGGTIEKELTHDIVIERNKVTPMKALQANAPAAILQNGSLFNATVKTLVAGATTTYNAADTSVEHIVIETESNRTTDVAVYDTDLAGAAVYAGWDAATKTVTLYTEAHVVYANPASSNMFMNFKTLKDISWNKLNFSKVTDASQLFDACNALTTISGLELPAATNVASLLRNCSSLTALGDLTFPLATNAPFLLAGCTSLASVGDIQLPKATNVSSLLNGDVLLSSLGTVNIPAANNTSSMFGGCTALESLSIYMNTQATSVSQNLSYMFQNCRNLKSISGQIAAQNVTQLQNMFYGCASLTSLNLTALQGVVTDIEQMFYGCTSLQMINFHSNLLSSTGNVSSFANMFYGCSSLTSLNLGSMSIAGATTLSGMFKGCSSLTSLTMPWVTFYYGTKLKDTSSLFEGCSNLASVDVSLLKGSITSLQSMFSGCAKLTEINLSSSFNTTGVASYAYVFYGCRSLASLYIKGFYLNKSNVTNPNAHLMDAMYAVGADAESCTIHYAATSGSYYYDITSATEGLSSKSEVDRSKLVWTTN